MHLNLYFIRWLLFIIKFWFELKEAKKNDDLKKWKKPYKFLMSQSTSQAVSYAISIIHDEEERKPKCWKRTIIREALPVYSHEPYTIERHNIKLHAKNHSIQCT